MSAPLILQVTQHGHVVHEASLTGPLMLGRADAGDPGPYAEVPASAGKPARLVIAPHEEFENLSRWHVLLEPLGPDQVKVTNHSRKPIEVTAPLQGSISTNRHTEMPPPFTLSLFGREVSVRPSRDIATGPGPGFGLQSLGAKTFVPAALSDISRRVGELPSLSEVHLTELVGILQIATGVVQATASSADFLDKAAEALVEIVKLDHGRVLLRDDDGWKTVAETGRSTPEKKPSRTVLDAVRERKETVWKTPRSSSASKTPSLKRSALVVAAPVLNPQGEVIGALYGERATAPTSGSDRLQAILVELIAGGVATGLARQEQEGIAEKARVNFEQFFGKDMAERVMADPSLLDPREAEVTCLFCDVRGFSTYSELLGPARTLEWMNDVMTAHSGLVLDEGGVLVDYVGDELFAMWGAPEPHADQAERAVRTALKMLAALEKINRKWQAILGGETLIGIGVNTGVAQVGNTGSQQKFKYGALGNPVNLASRVQGLTKYLKRPLLVTAATRDRLGDGFISRRVCKTRVVNIKEPVDLFEVEPAGNSARKEFFAESQEILGVLERGDFGNAARRTGSLLVHHPGDRPLLLILSRATAALVSDGEEFDPVWLPPGK